MFMCLVRESLQTVITQVILKITFFIYLNFELKLNL